MRSAVILVGGEARRANGREKYFFTYGRQTFIERLLDSLGQVVDEIVIVARDPDQCRRFNDIANPKVRCIHDIRQGLGPIGGLHAGSIEANGELIFVSACDMPCIKPAIVSHLFDRIDDCDAAIPSWNMDMLEPLHAVYRRTALLQYLESPDSLSLRTMIRSISTCYVPVEELRGIDPELLTFTNINKIEDLERINADGP